MERHPRQGRDGVKRNLVTFAEDLKNPLLRPDGLPTLHCPSKATTNRSLGHVAVNVERAEGLSTSPVSTQKKRAEDETRYGRSHGHAPG